MNNEIENLNLTVDELNMMKPDSSLKEELKTTTETQCLEVSSIAPSGFNIDNADEYANSLKDDIYSSPSIISEDFTFSHIDISTINNDEIKISLLFHSNKPHSSKDVTDNLEEDVRISATEDLDLFESYDDITIEISPLQVDEHTPTITEVYSLIEKFPEEISHFIQLNKSGDSDIRYSLIGFKTKKGFTGTLVDYCGGGNYEEMHIIEDVFLENPDDSTEDEFFEEVLRIFGAEKLLALQKYITDTLDWDDSYTPVSKLGPSEFEGDVSISNFPDPIEYGNTIFTSEIRANVLKECLTNPSLNDAPLILSSSEDALSTIARLIYTDFIKQPDFNFEKFIEDIVDPIYTYSSAQLLNLQNFVLHYRSENGLDSHDDLHYENYFVVTDERTIVNVGAQKDSDAAFNASAKINKMISSIWALDTADAKKFLAKIQPLIKSRVDDFAISLNNGEVYSFDDLTSGLEDTDDYGSVVSIRFNKTQANEMVEVLEDFFHSDHECVVANSVSINKDISRGV